MAQINRQIQSCVNLIKVVLNCLKFTKELELMTLNILNYRGVIDNVHNSLILSSRRNVIKRPPKKTIKIIGVVKAIFLPTCDIIEVIAYFINEDY